MSKIIKFYEVGFDPSSLIIQWNIGNTCNYSCEYCPSILHNGTRPWVELSLIEDTILKIQKFFPDRKIIIEFLGGEITLYRDFIDLMKFCKENNFPNMVFSNASRTFRHWSEVAPYLDKLLITFHPHTTDKDHFESIIKLFLNLNIEFYVHIALVKDLFRDTVMYAKYIHETYSNVHIGLTLMMDKEHTKDFNGYFYNYSDEEIDFVKNFDFGKERYIAEYDNGDTKFFSLNDIRDQKINFFKDFSCGQNRDIIVINNKGMASTSLCRQKPFINIFDDDIEKLFTGNNLCKGGSCDNPSDIRIYKELK